MPDKIKIDMLLPINYNISKINFQTPYLFIHTNKSYKGLLLYNKL